MIIYDIMDLGPVRRYVEEHGEKKYFRRGEMFCRRDCRAVYVGLVMNGAFGFSRSDYRGHEQIYSLALPNDIVSAFIARQPGFMSEFDIRALCPSEIMAVPMSDLIEHLERERPGYLHRLTESIAYGLMMRGFSFRCDSPEERYRELLSRLPRLHVHLTMTDTASYLGLSREAFARLRARIRDAEKKSQP